jgi:hypothetical protein
MARAAFLIVAILAAIQGCNPIGLTGDCSDETKLVVSSPDGRYVATWYERDCGTTTRFANIVSLRAAEAKFDPSDAAARIWVAKNQPRLRIRWQDDSTLRVECEECPKRDIVKQVKSWQGVTILHSNPSG